MKDPRADRKNLGDQRAERGRCERQRHRRRQRGEQHGRRLDQREDEVALLLGARAGERIERAAVRHHHHRDRDQRRDHAAERDQQKAKQQAAEIVHGTSLHDGRSHDDRRRRYHTSGGKR
ncbi:hypothetical protein A33M_2777 [Rhodovulum sp. PH10]|nr:hypothetical protein A33M_2777 [Rhodovulum sp. PH10]